MKPRDHSRLLVLDKKTGWIEHKHFYDLPEFLTKGDVLVFNDTKVMRARLIGRKETGGKVEVFLLKKEKTFKLGEIWQCLIGGPRRKEGLVVDFGKNLKAKVIKRNGDGTWQVEFNQKGKKMSEFVEKVGHMPLPPYIKRPDEKIDEKSYQTIYADQKKSGSVAAPTAGLHFTDGLMKKLKARGVQIEYLTLHVGLGTFAPVKEENIKKHKMHAEWVKISAKTARNLIRAKKEGKRIVAVGTTSVRTLEAAMAKAKNKSYSGWVNIFIYPGYKFKAVDGMITNFHLPKSTLLMLVSALAGKNKIDRAYREAINCDYRFFSYGDAMLLL